MPSNKCHIYLLPIYANLDNLETARYQAEYESKIEYNKDNLSLRLSERTSLVEERYCLSLRSAKYEIDSSNKIRESMIHHHPEGHPWRHLQFRLTADNKVIRINLEPLDEEDYTRCIKGFLHICQDIIFQEKEEQNIDADLVNHFFSQKINELAPFRNYLLNKVKAAYEAGNLLNDSDQEIDGASLKYLKTERHLLPFLDWG